MYKIRTFAAFLFIILLTLSGKTENPCGIMYPSRDSSSWGIGYIGFTQNNTFIKGTTCNTNTIVYIGNGLIRFNNDSIIQLDRRDYVRLGVYNQNLLLKVFQISDTKYKVCSNSLQESIWIEFDDLKSMKLHFNTYLSLITPEVKNIQDYIYLKSQNAAMGVNLINSCLNLRTKPSLSGDIVTCLSSNRLEGYRRTHIHVEILYFDVDWAFIVAREYEHDEKQLDESGDGCCYKVINEYRGYVKAIDDNGRPNIWYSGNGN